ncbi:MAG: hypothetical protein RJQ08_01785 [Salinisphaeraceae bacterium]
MKTNKYWVAGAALLAVSGVSHAQDPVANLTGGLNSLAINLNGTVNTLLMGDASATTQNLGMTVSTLIGDLSAGTPLAGLADSGIALSDSLTNAALGITPTLDGITIPAAQLGEPLTLPLIQVTDDLLGEGLPLLGGGELGGLPLLGGDLPGGDLLGGDGLPLIGGLLGGDDGGLPLVGGLLGDQEGIPVIGGLLGGEGGIPIIGGLLESEDGLPLIGGLLGGQGGLPIIGGLLGGGMVAGNGQGMLLAELPLPLESLDPNTAGALVNGVTLAGL